MRSSQLLHPRTLCPALALCQCISGSALAVPPEGPARLLSASHEAYASAMLSGGPGKDGIPAIDSPRFSDAASADGFLDPQDIVFGIYHQGQARAYPQRILVWHEIVNDRLGQVAGAPPADPGADPGNRRPAQLKPRPLRQLPAAAGLLCRPRRDVPGHAPGQPPAGQAEDRK